MRKLTLILIASILAVSVVTVVWWPQPDPQRQNDKSEVAGGDFVLQSAAGPVALHDFRGKVVLLYFGYTWCPDVCPTSLSLMGQALRHLSKTELEHVQGVFVSVDPERDTLDRLATYARYFHPNIMGITGTPAQVATVAKQYGAAYHKVPGASASEYVVDHTSFTCVIDKQGHIYKVLPHGTAPDEIDAAIRHILTEQP